MARERPRPVHPYVPELEEQLRTGVVDRRGVRRTVTLLGMSAAAALAPAARATS